LVYRTLHIDATAEKIPAQPNSLLCKRGYGV
jgi:hypothetical protein